MAATDRHGQLLLGSLTLHGGGMGRAGSQVSRGRDIAAFSRRAVSLCSRVKLLRTPNIATGLADKQE